MLLLAMIGKYARWTYICGGDISTRTSKKLFQLLFIISFPAYCTHTIEIPAVKKGSHAHRWIIVEHLWTIFVHRWTIFVHRWTIFVHRWTIARNFPLAVDPCWLRCWSDGQIRPEKLLWAEMYRVRP